MPHFPHSFQKSRDINTPKNMRIKMLYDNLEAVNDQIILLRQKRLALKTELYALVPVQRKAELQADKAINPDGI